MPLSNKQNESLKMRTLKNVRQILNDPELLYAALKESAYIKNTKTKRLLIEPGELQIALNDLDYSTEASTYKIDNPSRLGNTLINSGFSKAEIQLMPASHKAIYESILYVANKEIYSEINAHVIPESEPLQTLLADLHTNATRLSKQGHHEVAAKIINLYNILHAATTTYAHSAQTNQDKIQFKQTCSDALNKAAPTLSDHRGYTGKIGIKLKKIGDILKIKSVSQKGEALLTSPTTPIQLTQKFKENLHQILGEIKLDAEPQNEQHIAPPKIT